MSAIVEYSETAAGLAKLREDYGRTYDVSTREGMEEARKARRHLVNVRTTLEAKRKELKAPALDRCRAIDAEAHDIEAQILKLEEPIDAAIKAEEARKEAEKAAIVAAAKKRADAAREDCELMRDMVTKAALGVPAADIAEAIEIVRQVPIPGNEHDEEITKTRDEVIVTLGKLRAAAMLREEEEKRLADLRAELERQKAEADRARAEQAAKDEAALKAERERIATQAREAAAKLAAEAKAAAEKIAAEEAEAKASRDRADAVARAERDRLEAESRAARAEQDRIAREVREKEEAGWLAERQRLDAERLAAEARAKADREVEEAKQRAIHLERQRRLDARGLLVDFVRLYGDLPEHTILAKAIRDHLLRLEEQAEGRAA